MRQPLDRSDGVSPLPVLVAPRAGQDPDPVRRAARPRVARRGHRRRARERRPARGPRGRGSRSRSWWPGWRAPRRRSASSASGASPTTTRTSTSAPCGRSRAPSSWPGPLAVVVAIAIYLHIYLRVWRRNRVPVHRVLFSTATILLAVQAAAAVTDRIGHDELFRSVPGVLAVVAAMVVYMLVNLALVVLVIVCSGPSRRLATVRQAIGPFDDVALEFATLAMGALVAAAASTFGAALRPARAAAADRPAPHAARPPARGGRQHRREDGPAHRGGLAGQGGPRRTALRAGRPGRQRARARPRPLQARQRPLRAPRRRPGAGRRRRVACATRCATRTSSAGSAARSSSCCCRGPTARTRGRGRAPSPSGSGSGSPRCASPSRGRRRRWSSRGSPCRSGAPPPRATAPTSPALLEIADAAMYEAKRAGRNLVRMGLPVEHPAAAAQGRPRDLSVRRRCGGRAAPAVAASASAPSAPTRTSRRAR